MRNVSEQRQAVARDRLAAAMQREITQQQQNGSGSAPAEGVRGPRVSPDVSPFLRRTTYQPSAEGNASRSGFGGIPGSNDGAWWQGVDTMNTSSPTSSRDLGDSWDDSHSQVVSPYADINRFGVPLMGGMPVDAADVKTINQLLVSGHDRLPGVPRLLQGHIVCEVLTANAMPLFHYAISIRHMLLPTGGFPLGFMHDVCAPGACGLMELVAGLGLPRRT